MTNASASATVTVAGTRHLLDPHQPFTFGRGEGCSACLDADDVGLSRLAGSIELDGGAWWVTNRSASRPLAVVDPIGTRSVLAPGRRLALDGPVTVVAEGAVRRHALEVVVPEDQAPPVPTPDGTVETSLGTDVAYNEADRLALVALFAGYLRPFPRHDPHPRSYADSAADLGWPRSTLVKRIEYVRIRLTKAGVPNLQGDNALEHLAEHVLTTGVIAREDLDLLDH